MQSGVYKSHQIKEVPLIRFRELVQDYIQLTKPRIVLLFALTGFSAMVMEGSFLHSPFKLFMIITGIILTAGSANALNQYIDRDIDAVMERTRKKRPIPQGRLTPENALIFGLVTGVIATGVLYYYGSILAAALGLGTILFYVCIYTMWLKRKTPYNIVIGGAAGATAPLIGWAAASGEISLSSFILFAIIFMWTPPHFWALALCVKDEYAKASVPMLPVVAGDRVTRNQIFWYSVGLVPLTFLLVFTQSVGWIYLLAAALLGSLFLKKAFEVKKQKTEELAKPLAWKMFGYSIVYLLALYVFLILDALLLKPVHAAEKIPQELQNVGIQERLGNQVDLDLQFRNEKGELVALRSAFDGHRPVLLFLVYYGCPNLCNFFMNGAIDSLKEFTKSPAWVPGKQFQIVTVSIDPREQPALATKKKANVLAALGHPENEKIAQNWHFWVAGTTADAQAPETLSKETSSKKLADSVGFQYKYDKAQNQFAHSSAMVVLTPEGKVSRYLYGIEFKPTDLKFALVEAGGRKIGNLVDRLLLFCYNYDPKTRKYSLYAMNLMRAGGAITTLALLFMLFIFWRRNRTTAGIFENLDSVQKSPDAMKIL